MSNKTLIIVIVSIVVGLGLLSVGCFGGGIYQQEKNKPELERLEKVEKTVEAINSTTIASIVVFGKVSKISDRLVTVTAGGKNLDISVKEDTQINSIVPVVSTQKGVPTYTTEQIKSEFSDIKVGSQISSTITILPNGMIEAFSVIVFSPLAKENP